MLASGGSGSAAAVSSLQALFRWLARRSCEARSEALRSTLRGSVVTVPITENQGSWLCSEMPVSINRDSWGGDMGNGNTNSYGMSGEPRLSQTDLGFVCREGVPARTTIEKFVRL